MLYYGMIRSYPERSFCLVSQQTQRKLTGIAFCRGAAHPRHRADPELHHRPAPDERADGVPLRRGAAGGGHDVLPLGAELAMSPMGERVGACITKTRRVGIMLTLGFLLGFHHHFRAGPAGARQSGAGRAEHGAHRHRGGRRGLFLCFAMLRMLLSVPLNTMLVGFYIVVFVLAMFVPAISLPWRSTPAA